MILSTLGQLFQSNRACGKEEKTQVQAGWRKISGVMCDKRVTTKVNRKVYELVIRPAILFGLETGALTKRQKAKLEVAELKMLRFSLRVMRMDRIRNEHIRCTAKIGHFGDKVR